MGSTLAIPDVSKVPMLSWAVNPTINAIWMTMSKSISLCWYAMWWEPAPLRWSWYMAAGLSPMDENRKMVKQHREMFIYRSCGRLMFNQRHPGQITDSSRHTKHTHTCVIYFPPGSNNMNCTLSALEFWRNNRTSTTHMLRQTRNIYMNRNIPLNTCTTTNAGWARLGTQL